MDPETKKKTEKTNSEKKKEIGNKIGNKIDKTMEKPYVRVGKKTLELFLKNDMIVYAGHATLGVLTAIFPLIMLIISLLNMMPGYDPEIFTDFVFRFLPDIPQFRSLFYGIVKNLRSQSTGILALVSAATALWSASGGVTNIQKGLVKITPGAEKSLRDKPAALVCTVILVVLIPVVLIANVMGGALAELLTNLSSIIGFDSVVKTVISVIRCSGVMSAVAAVFFILGMYTWLPGGKRSLKSQLPGAVFCFVCWMVFTFVFVKFLPLFWKSSVYGSLASIFLFITWARILFMILFLGGALNGALADEQNGTGV